MLGVIAGDETDWEPEGYGDVVCTEGNEEVEYVAEIDGDAGAVEADNAVDGVCEVPNELGEYLLDSEALKVLMIETMVTMISTIFTRIDAQPIIILCVLLFFWKEILI